MEKRRKLFLKRDPYRAPRDSGLFLRSVRELAEYHAANCEGYARILRERGFDPAMLKTEDDLYKLPVIPTLFFKRNRLFSVPEKKLKVLATSSGTSGSKSVVGLDGRSLFLGVGMMIRFFLYHRVGRIEQAEILSFHQPEERGVSNTDRTAVFSRAPSSRRDALHVSSRRS